MAGAQNSQTCFRARLCVVVLALTAAASAKPTLDDALKLGHFGGILPELYEIELKAAIGHPSFTLQFEGRMNFRFTVVVDELDVIYLQAKNLRFYEATVDSRPVVSIVLDASNELVKFELGRRLKKKTSHVLTLAKFGGEIGGPNKMGLFVSRISGWPAQRALFSQFQMNEARSAFPCVDLPQFKAHFQLTLIHQDHYRALGNMRMSWKRREAAGWHRTEFESSPLLATYTVGLALLPEAAYRRLATISKRGLQLALFYNPYQYSNELASRLADYARYAVDYSEQLFHVRLPINKVDFVTFPDFVVQGMENFGLITLNEKYLARQRAPFRLSLLVHEVVHLWISNLITVTSWRDLCLQEGLTDHFARDAVRKYFAGTERDVYFSSYMRLKYLTAIRRESRPSQPQSLLLSRQPSLAEVSLKCFDKAVFLVDSFSTMLGERRFNRLLSAFVRKHQFGNFDMSHFVSHFDGAKVDRRFAAGQVLRFWFERAGYPSLFVQRSSSPLDALTVRQSQLHAKPGGGYVLYNATWPVVIDRIRTATYRKVDSVVLANGQQLLWTAATTPLSPLGRRNDSDADWFILNEDFAHFYRVNYDAENWRRLADQLLNRPQIFNSITRLQLVEDFCFFYRIGLLNDSAARQIRTRILLAVQNHHAMFYGTLC